MAAERPRIKILRFVILLAMLSMVRKKKIGSTLYKRYIMHWTIKFNLMTALKPRECVCVCVPCTLYHRTSSTV